MVIPSNSALVLTFISISLLSCASSSLIVSSLNLSKEVIEAKDNFHNFITQFTDDANLQKKIVNYLKSLKKGPNLKEAISKLEQTDFLFQYKLAERNEDKNLNVTGLAAKYGYNLEKYNVTTEDGYIISAYRIPSEGEPVLLVHGLLSSAVDWFTIGREVALAYQLADLGYDVWLINTRGAVDDSKGHVSLNPEKDAEQYWNFSWDEIGRYDLPAVIDFVLETTGKKKLRYVGHSQGTTTFFVMASERPEYNDKISIAVNLAPSTWQTHAFSPLVRIMALFVKPLKVLLHDVLGLNEFDAKRPLIQFLTKVICGNSAGATLICGNLMFALSGFDYEMMNVTQLPVIFAHTPSSVSINQILHYGQIFGSEKFKKFDHGPLKNKEKYGSEEPPEYPVHKVTAPVAIFYKKNTDWFSAYEDVVTLKNHLSNCVYFYEVPYKHWCHTDYIFAKGAKDLVYDRIIKLFNKY